LDFQPAIDSVLKLSGEDSLKEQNIIRDSIAFIKERDSFYSIPPVGIYIGDENGEPFQKLVASIFDTTRKFGISRAFLKDEKLKFDKDQNPVSRTTNFHIGNYKVKLIEDDSGNDSPSKLFIDGKIQRPGKELDTSLAWEAFITLIELDPEKFRIVNFSNKEYLYLAGHVKRCNGRGCSVIFHLLYDPRSNHSFVISQYMFDEFYTSFDPLKNEVRFLVMDNGIINEGLNYFPYNGKIYRFTNEGKVIPAKGNNGKQMNFRGYSTAGSYDTIVLTSKNF
jgi:hypothetical protein